ncbi:MAG: DUF983 domain-containing protein [Acidimicrobiales bacterium]
MLRRALARRCPQCGSGGLFRGWLRMVEHCPGCAMRFEREEGFFLGAYFINIVITQMAIVTFVAVAFALTLPDAPLALGTTYGDGPPWLILAGAVLIAVAVPLFCYPLSKTLWSAVHLLMAPLEPEEQAEAAARRFERGDASDGGR